VNAVRIVAVEGGAHLETVRQLFQEYASSLEIDLCFQNFAQELANLPGNYAPPRGRLLLGLQGREAVGCIALRPISRDIAEVKRLYVRPLFRRAGVGRRLAQAVIVAARRIGYSGARLDTLATMREAIALYQSLGFQPISPYYENPNAAALFMELKL